MQYMLMCCIEEKRWLELPDAERDAVTLTRMPVETLCQDTHTPPSNSAMIAAADNTACAP